MEPLRVIIADDERPARALLASTLRAVGGATIVGEASGGAEAVELIERISPDLALLDLAMPEVDGLAVVRLVHPDRLPLVAFVTAYDEYAVRAFELSALDYLLKPVEPDRLRRTLARAQERLESADERAAEMIRMREAIVRYDARVAETGFLRRIPVRRRDDTIILRVDHIAAVIADGVLLQIVTVQDERYTITYRLKDLEARLDPSRFIRVSRGALVSLDAVQRVSEMTNGTYVVILANKLQIPVSRTRARVLRQELLRL